MGRMCALQLIGRRMSSSLVLTYITVCYSYVYYLNYFSSYVSENVALSDKLDTGRVETLLLLFALQN